MAMTCFETHRQQVIERHTYKPTKVDEENRDPQWTFDNAHIIVLMRENGQQELFAVLDGKALGRGVYASIYPAVNLKDVTPSCSCSNNPPQQASAPIHKYTLPLNLTYNYVAKCGPSFSEQRKEVDVLQKLGREAFYYEECNTFLLERKKFYPQCKAKWIEEQARKATIIEPFVKGATLAAFLENNGLNPAESLELKKKLAAAVFDMHSKGVIHGDLHAENIIVDKTKSGFEVTIIDFGKANRSPYNYINYYKYAGGPPRHLAPEITPDDGGVVTDTKKSDIYALGVAFQKITEKTLYAKYSERVAAEVLDDSLCSEDARQRPTASGVVNILNGNQSLDDVINVATPSGSASTSCSSSSTTPQAQMLSSGATSNASLPQLSRVKGTMFNNDAESQIKFMHANNNLLFTVFAFR